MSTIDEPTEHSPDRLILGHLFAWSVRRERSEVVVVIVGEVDLGSRPELSAALRDLIADQGQLSITVDLAGVTFLDSTGLNLLIGADRALRERGGRLTLANPSLAVTRIFDLVGLADYFDQYAR